MADVPVRWLVAMVVMGLSIVTAATVCTIAPIIAIPSCTEACGPGRVDYIVIEGCSCKPDDDAPSAAALSAMDRR